MENLDNLSSHNAEEGLDDSVEEERVGQLHYDDLSFEQKKIVDDFFREVTQGTYKEGKNVKLQFSELTNLPLELHTAIAERFIKGHYYNNSGDNTISDRDFVVENFDFFKNLDGDVAVNLLKSNSRNEHDYTSFVFDNLDKFDNLNFESLLVAIGPKILALPDILAKFPSKNFVIEKLISSLDDGNLDRFLDFFSKNIEDIRRDIDEQLIFKALISSQYMKRDSFLAATLHFLNYCGPFDVWPEIFNHAKVDPKILYFTEAWSTCSEELEKKDALSLEETEVLFSLNSLVITDWLWRHRDKLKHVEEEKLAAFFLVFSSRHQGELNAILAKQNPEKYLEKNTEYDEDGNKVKRRIRSRSQFSDGVGNAYHLTHNFIDVAKVQFPAEIDKQLASFSDLDRSKLLEHLSHLNIEPKFFIENGELFPEIDKNVKLNILETLTLLSRDLNHTHYFKKYFDFFSELDSETLVKYCLKLVPSFIFDLLDKLSDVDRLDLVRQLIERGLDRLLDDNYTKLNWGLDDREIAYIINNPALKFSEYLINRDLLTGVNEAGLDPEDKTKEMFSRLKEKSVYWKDEENVTTPFEQGADVFGYDKMWDYISRKDLSRHDALHNFPTILSLAQASGLEPKQFFYQILAQVKKDEASYYEGSAHHHLNMLVNNLSLDLETVLAEAKKYTDISEMQQALQGIESPADVFSSWKTLKKYADIFQLLKKKEILDELVELKQSGQLKLFNYVEKLAFHPNVDLKAVVQFWKNTNDFLDVEEIHAASSHERKKPSRYTNIPNLDLSAEDLRDALVEGYYDSMQSFQPLSIEYVVRDLDTADLSKLIGQALGSYRQSIPGQAQDAKKLFAELNSLFKTQGMNLQEYLKASAEQKIELAPELQERVAAKLFDASIGLKVKNKKYRAQVHLKSDPDAVVAGNDTSCCMPFGSGKNNVYTFNPITSLFTVQVETEDGRWRTVAQSVLTRDKDIGVQVDELVERLSSEHTSLNELISEDILRKSKGIITCDNVEVAENFLKDNFGKVLEDIYRDFFQEYTQHFAAQDDLDPSRAIIGMGHSDALTHLPEVDNHFVPEAPVGYSDNTNKKSLVLNLGAQESLRLAHRAIHLEPKLKAEQFAETMSAKEILPKGVDYLTFRDSLSVAYIEGKAYHDNQNLMQYLHNMENALIAKDVNNTSKERPNMSLQYRDSDGKTRAYLLAYEGKKDKDGEDLIYVADLASDGHARAGASLVLGFVDLYKENYLAKGDLKPIYAQLREQTSYKLVMNQLDKISKSLGIRFEVDELSSYEAGDDTMHEVILRPVKM